MNKIPVIEYCLMKTLADEVSLIDCYRLILMFDCYIQGKPMVKINI